MMKKIMQKLLSMVMIIATLFYNFAPMAVIALEELAPAERELVTISEK